MKQLQKVYEDAINRFKFNLDLALKNCRFLYTMAKNAELTNEKYFIDWLNELSRLDEGYRKL